MEIVVDTNIVFSAALKSSNRIGQLLTLGSRFFNFYSIDLLKEEIDKHKGKLVKFSGLTNEQLESNLSVLYTKIKFVDTIILSNEEIDSALQMTEDIDINDTLFVALANHLNGLLWTGDVKLRNGLESKGIDKTISTEELYSVYKKMQE